MSKSGLAKLRPHQIIGIVALLVFGTILVRQLLKPKRDPFSVPGAMPMRDIESLPRREAEAIAAPSSISTPSQPLPTTDLLRLGPQDARDDLYCSGLIYAHHRASGDTMSVDAQKRRDKIVALAERGVARLLASGAAKRGETAAIADAHSTQALADFAAGRARFTLEACMMR